MVLRLEDHDRSRCRLTFEDGLLNTLDWLGLEPDRFPTASFREDPIAHPARQSNQSARYAAALAQLEAAGSVYPCTCSRKQIARVVDQSVGAEARYPGTCQTANHRAADTPARRVQMAPGGWMFDDLRLGPLVQEPAAQCGDLLARDRLGHWTYQFAVVVDDLAHAIDVVIRGEDLLTSTGRQLQLASMLARPEPPLYCHHPLLVHPDGRKLSKAGQDTSLLSLRAAGWTVPALIGQAAWRSGLLPTDRPVPFQAVVDRLVGAE